MQHIFIFRETGTGQGQQLLVHCDTYSLLLSENRTDQHWSPLAGLHCIYSSALVPARWLALLMPFVAYALAAPLAAGGARPVLAPALVIRGRAITRAGTRPGAGAGAV